MAPEEKAGGVAMMVDREVGACSHGGEQEAEKSVQTPGGDDLQRPDTIF